MGSFRDHNRKMKAGGQQDTQPSPRPQESALRERDVEKNRKDCGSVFCGNRAARQRGRQDQVTRLDLVAVQLMP